MVSGVGAVSPRSLHLFGKAGAVTVGQRSVSWVPGERELQPDPSAAGVRWQRWAVCPGDSTHHFSHSGHAWAAGVLGGYFLVGRYFPPLFCTLRLVSLFFPTSVNLEDRLDSKSPT